MSREEQSPPRSPEGPGALRIEDFLPPPAVEQELLNLEDFVNEEERGGGGRGGRGGGREREKRAMNVEETHEEVSLFNNKS